MKKLILSTLIASVPFLATTGANASTTKLINEDGSKLSALCVAAAQTEGSVTELAKSMDINAAELDKIACNGQPLMSFVRSHRKMLLEAGAVNYSFNHGDTSMETELCIAAVTAPDKYAALMPEYKSKNGAAVEKVMCNNQPLDSFVRRFGSQSLSSL